MFWYPLPPSSLTSGIGLGDIYEETLKLIHSDQFKAFNHPSRCRLNLNCHFSSLSWPGPPVSCFRPLVLGQLEGSVHWPMSCPMKSAKSLNIMVRKNKPGQVIALVKNVKALLLGVVYFDQQTGAVS